MASADKLPAPPEDHQPLDTEEVLWRYMDIFKLMDFLQTSQLHFTRADQMEDHWEGVGGYHGPNETDSMGRRGIHISLKKTEDIHRFTREAVYMNCWHRGRAESYAMWRMYAPYGAGVAIKSTVQRVINTIHLSGHTMDIIFSPVSYVDFEKYLIPLTPIHTPYVFKRECYEFEQEFRIIQINEPPIEMADEELVFSYKNPAHPKFIRRNVSVDQLVEAIYISPDAPEWIGNTITRIVETFAPGVSVIHSNLGQAPELFS